MSKNSNALMIAAKYRKELYLYLRNDYGGDNKPIPRDSWKDKNMIDGYERAIKKLGLIPETKEILKEVEHDNNAVFYRLNGMSNSLLAIFYKDYSKITHVLDNKNKYIRKEINYKEVSETLKNSKGIIIGIGKNSICVESEEGNKEFFWYLPAPLTYNNCNSKGVDLCKYLINKYGE